MGNFEDLNSAGLRAIGLKPEWSDHSLETAIPNGTGGISLIGAPVALFGVSVRKNPAFRTASTEYSTVDLTASTYTITVDGNAVAYDASVELPATATDLIQGICDKLNADATVGALVVAVPDPVLPDSKLVLSGRAAADYSFDSAVSGGTAVISANVADPMKVSVRLWVQLGGIIKSANTGWANKWIEINGGSYSVTSRGLVERVECAGFDRLFVQLDSVTGVSGDGSTVEETVAWVGVGPSVIEGSA